MQKILNRLQQAQIEQALKIRRVVVIGGARQSGKTTLARQVSANNGSGNVEYISLDDPNLRNLAMLDPKAFVEPKAGTKTIIIDEIQKAPELLSAIKLKVDQNTSPGQYIITGSANIHALPGVIESLAGRIRKIRLRTLTRGEILGTKPDFLQKAFAGNLLEAARPDSTFYDRTKIIELALIGGFPEVVQLGYPDKSWHRDYIATLIERDLKDVANINRHEIMQQLVVALASWSSKFIDVSKIASKLEISRITANTYISALNALYITETIPAWVKTDYARIGKHAKIFMSDSGLMASILNFKKDQVLTDSDQAGKLLETFVFNELAAAVDEHPEEYALFHYRDREQHEIDFIIENSDGAILGVEVKASSVMHKADFKNLTWFRDNIADGRKFTGVVLYTGDKVAKIGDDFWLIPLAYLW